MKRRANLRPWADDEVAYLEMARRAVPPMTFVEIAGKLGRSTNSVWSKWKGLRDDHGDPTRQYSGFRQYRNLKPAINPNTPDSSTPKYAEDERHLALIAKANGGKGFPYLNIPPAYRVAA